MKSLQAITQPNPQNWLATGALLVGAFMNMLDATIVNLALPAIRDDLGAGPNIQQWILVAYLLTFAAGLLPLGRFGDLFGRKRMFMAGLCGFLATSLAAGMATSAYGLVLSRAVQGAAAAAMVPQVLAIIHELFEPEERGKAIGLFGMANALGAVAGPVIGGFLISADLYGLGWRLVFLINLPIGLAALAGAALWLPKDKVSKRGKADWLGAGCFALCISLLIYPMIEGRSLGWPVWLISAPVVATIFALAFWRRQRWLAAVDRLETLPTTLMTHSGYLTGVASVMVVISGLAGTMVILAITLQTGLGLTPAAAGLAIISHPLCAMLASFFSGRFGSRWLALRVTGGLFCLFAGLVWLRIAGMTMMSGVDILGPLILVGSGAGLIFVALFQSTLAEVSALDAGAGSGALQACQQVGIAFGIAIIGQIFFATLQSPHVGDGYRTAFTTALTYPIVMTAALFLFSLRKYLFKRTNR